MDFLFSHEDIRKQYSELLLDTKVETEGKGFVYNSYSRALNFKAKRQVDEQLESKDSST